MYLKSLEEFSLEIKAKIQLELTFLNVISAQALRDRVWFHERPKPRKYYFTSWAEKSLTCKEDRTYRLDNFGLCGQAKQDLNLLLAAQPSRFVKGVSVSGCVSIREVGDDAHDRHLIIFTITTRLQARIR